LISTFLAQGRFAAALWQAYVPHTTGNDCYRVRTVLLIETPLANVTPLRDVLISVNALRETMWRQVSHNLRQLRFLRQICELHPPLLWK
jgi:hypothetical protein